MYAVVARLYPMYISSTGFSPTKIL